MSPISISISASHDPDHPMRWRVLREGGYVHIELHEVIRVGGVEMPRRVTSLTTSEAGAAQLLAALSGEAVEA